MKNSKKTLTLKTHLDSEAPDSKLASHDLTASLEKKLRVITSKKDAEEALSFEYAINHLDEFPECRKFCTLSGEIIYEDILIINSLCLFEGEPFQVVNKSMIESAIGNQYQPYSRRELAFASVYKSLILNHGFANGNKRTAVIILYIASMMMNNEFKINDRDLAKLTYKIAGENGGQVPVEEIAEQVFKCYATKGDFKEIDDITYYVKEFIKEHQWLMKELAK